jgi:hypothetical protein
MTLYRRFDGEYVKFLGSAKYGSEDMVIYEKTNGHKEITTWDDFFGYVVIDGKEVPKFENVNLGLLQGKI